MLNAYHYMDKINEMQVIGLWDAIVGRLIARETKGLFIRNKVLYVRLTSPVLKDELGYARSQLIKKLNKGAGCEVITDIAFV
jgi:predicted nucleic acid-binding Zn ribbon protein